MKRDDRVIPTSPLTLAIRGLMTAAVTLGVSANLAAAPAATDRGTNDYRHPPASANIPWIFTHGTVYSDDSLNQSFPVLPVELRWHQGARQGQGPFATPGWLSAFGAYLHPDGVHVWAGSAEGNGFPMVHVVDRFTGEVVWESNPYNAFDPDSPDSGPSQSLAFSFFVTDVDGNVFITDNRYIWSWDQDFNQRFRVRLPVVPNADGVPTQIEGGPVGTAIITGEGLIGGATDDGFWLFWDRLTGEIVVAEAMVNPTPVAVPCQPALQALGALAGLLVPEIGVEDFAVPGMCLSFGRGQPVTESNSLDPETDLIYQYVGAEGTDDRFVVQYQLVDDPANPGGKTVEVRNITDGQPPGGATTPTVSVNTQTVVVADGDGAFKAFNLADMSLAWATPPGNEAALSPALDQFGNLVAADRADLYKFDKDSGEILWQRNYDYLAPGVLPTLRPFPLLVPDGSPKSFLTSVQVTAPDEFQTIITYGYKIQNPGIFLPQEALDWPSPFLSGYALTDPDSGDNLGSSTFDLQGGGVDTAPNPTKDGWVTSSVTDVFGLIESLTLDPLLPPRFKSPGPAFGVFALETESHLANVGKRLDECAGWNKEASQNLKRDPQRAFDVARRCVPALEADAIQQEVLWAARDNEISIEQAAAANASLQLALASQTAAKEGLLAEVYSEKAVSAALRASDKAMRAAQQALKVKGGGKP